MNQTPQTITCHVLLGVGGFLFVVSDRAHGPQEHKFTYAGQPIEAAEQQLPGVPQLPASQLEALRTQARSRERRVMLELMPEWSGGDPVPVMRPYWPWDLVPATADEATGSGEQISLPF